MVFVKDFTVTQVPCLYTLNIGWIMEVYLVGGFLESGHGFEQMKEL